MTVGIVGLGLIGGSIGLALREPGRRVIGFDPNADSIKAATDRGCVDEVASLDQVALADVVFVAVPPSAVVKVLDQLVDLRGEDTVLTDCTSVKAGVVEWARANKDSHFVVGHPMAGHENSGAAFASAWMYRGARWILSPLEFTDRRCIRRVEVLVKAMNAVPVHMAPETHDRQVALVSHLPHALAAQLLIMRSAIEGEDVAGGSWRDLTRVGGADPNLWTQIYLENRLEVARSLGNMVEGLMTLQRALENNDMAAVREFFESAKRAK